MIVALLAILKAGGGYVPLDPAYPKDRIRFVLDDARVQVLLTQSSLHANLHLEAPNYHAIYLDTDWDVISKLPIENPQSDVAPANLAYVIHTSGSSGKPKGVEIEHRAVVNFLTSMLGAPGLTADDILLAVTTASFDMAGLELLLPLVAGAQVVIAGNTVTADGSRLAWLIQESRATVMQATPATWRLLLEAGWQGIPQLKILCGGEAWSKDLADKLLPRCRSLWNMYGPTETTIFSSVHQVEAGAKIVIGRPIANTSFYVLNASLQPAPVGVVGELYIGGEGLARGYLNQPALTKERFVADPFSGKLGARLYKTGDLVRFLESGCIEFIGRADQQVKIRGYRVELGEIEEVLKCHADVREAVAVAREDERGDKQLLAYVRAARSGDNFINGLRSELRRQLPVYMVPRDIIVLETFPLTPNGKIDRKALPRPISSADPKSSYLAPRTETEETLARIWCEVLKLKKIGTHDNFFDLGGHSLRATQVASRVRNTLQVDVTVRVIFQQPTIADLANYVDQLRDKGNSTGATSARFIARSNEQSSPSPGGLHDAQSDLRSGRAYERHYSEQREIELEDSYPLSPLQQGMLFHALWEKGSGVDIQQIIIDLNDVLHLDKFKRAWSRIVARHSVLRTSFRWEGVEQPQQQVHAKVEMPWVEQDWHAFGYEEQEKRCTDFLTEDRRRGFDLARAPLFRFALLRRGEAENRLLWTYHHILLDAESRYCIVREVFALYEAFLRDEDLALPRPRPFRDYIDWLQRQDFRKDEAFWRQSLKGFTAPTRLKDLHAPEVRCTGSRLGSEDNKLSTRTTSALRLMAKANGLSLATITLGAWAILLSRHSNETDVVFGVVRSNRWGTIEGADNVIGLCINTLPMRVHVDTEKSLLSWLKGVRAQWIATRDHAHTPLATVQSWSEVPAGQSLFTTIVNFQNYHQETKLRMLGGAWGNRRFRIIQQTNFPFNLSVYDSDELHLTIPYDRSRLDDNAAAQMLCELRALLEKMATEPQQSIGELSGAILRDDKSATAPSIVPVARGQQLALSFAQESLWVIDQLNPESAVYNIPLLLWLDGTLDAAALVRALEEVVRRHEALRTRFEVVADRPVQVVAPMTSVEMPVIDLSAEPQPEADVMRLCREEARRPFNLARDLMLRARLFRLELKRHVLFLNLHHIAVDGWSVAVLLRELGILYEAFCQAQSSPLQELPIQYADFSAWQRDWLQGEVLEQQLGYWRTQLAGVPALLELPTDRPRPARQSSRGATETALLPGSLLTAIKALSRHEGASLFMTLLAAFQTLLSRYCGQEDITIGSPIAGRNRIELEGLIGFFVNTLVLRGDLSGNPTFRDLLRRTKEVTLGAYAHQDLPFEKLVQELQPERNSSYHPIFQVMISQENTATAPTQLGGLGLSVQGVSSGTSKCDLTMFVSEGADGLKARVEYCPDLFDAETIRRMLGHYQVLLEGIVANPEARVAELPILTEVERHQLLVEWNQTEVDYPHDKCVHQLFEAQVERTPDAIALTCDGAQMTYRELNQRANQLARYLQKLGVGSETLVGICLERSFEMVIALLGVLKSGGAYVPLDPENPQDRLAFILRDANVSVLLTQARLVNVIPAHLAHIVQLDADWPIITRESKENSKKATTASSLAYVIYTSGSTGRPKGVMITHRNIVRLFQATYDWFHFDRTDVWTLFHSFAFDFSVWEIWGALFYGGRLVIVPYLVSRTPEEFYNLVIREGVTVLNQTPSAFKQLMETERTLKQPEKSALRYMIFGGEKLEMQSLRSWFDRHGDQRPRLVNMYGITETTVHVTYRPILKDDTQSLRSVIGVPIPDLQIYILNSHGQPLPIGIAGEMCVGGAGLAQGYWNRAELTKEKFVPNPFRSKSDHRLYKSGDLARYLPDGNIEFLGRIDNQVKIRGYRIELGEIELVLKLHPAVREAVVVVREDAPGDRKLVAYVMPASADVQADELRKFLKEKLPAYMLPSAFVFTDAFPLTPNGKLDRKALPEPEAHSLEPKDLYVAPRTPTEEALATIWCDLLNLKQVGVHDNFFELGGHSLLATQLMSRVRNIFQIEIAVRSVFEAPTIADLAKCIDGDLSEGNSTTAPSIVPVARGQQLALSFAQESLWVIDQLNPESAVYNIPLLLWLDGTLDVAALVRALEEVVRRHEALRTRFEVVADRPVQVVAPMTSVEMPVIDLSAEPQPEADVMRLCREEARRPFNLARDLMLRARLFRLELKRHVLFLNLHHIAVDGWSVAVLLRELGILYEAFCQAQSSPLQELPIQYADFSAWQRDWLQGEVLEQQLGYWRTQLAGVPALLELPTDRPRPARQSSRGATETALLPGSLLTAIKALSRHEGASLFMTLLAAFQTLLSRYCGQEDITIGSPIAGRNRIELEGLIGFFVNTLVLRGDLSGNPTFRDLLRRTKEVTLGAYAHQDLPFEKLVQELQPERNARYHPLVQVMISQENTATAPTQLGGLGLSVQGVSSGTSKCDLTMFVSEGADGLKARVEYCPDLFDAETIRRMLGHYQVLLEGIVANPEARVAELPILTEVERHQLLVEWNQTEVDYPRDKCVHQLFEAQVERTPDAMALTCDGAQNDIS